MQNYAKNIAFLREYKNYIITKLPVFTKLQNFIKLQNEKLFKVKLKKIL